MKWVKRYVLHPLKLLFDNTSIFLVFFVVIFVNFVSDKNGAIPLDALGQWAFRTLPSALIALLQQPAIVSILAATFLLKTILTVFVAKEMLMIYQRRRKSIKQSLTEMRLQEIWWFFLCECIAYCLFGSIALALYLPSYFVYHHYAIDCSYALVAAFVVLYPAFYILLSTGSMMSVLSLPANRRWQKLRILLLGKPIFTLYGFYFCRISLELALLFVAPYVALKLTHSYWLAIVTSAAGLILPFALLRGSAYELKLRLLSSDAEIRALFDQHYAEVD